jgi:predicted DNA-binding helix-hairpin-helix protein
LYQADWLLRHSGFTVAGIAEIGVDGMLDLAIDPKLAWALKHRERFPVDVNTGERDMLLRVPGLGRRAVERMVTARRHTTLRLADVGRLTGGLKRARVFLVAADHRPTRPTDRANLRRMLVEPVRQLALF